MHHWLREKIKRVNMKVFLTILSSDEISSLMKFSQDLIKKILDSKEGLNNPYDNFSNNCQDLFFSILESMYRIEKTQSIGKKAQLKNVMMNERMCRSLIAYCADILFYVKNLKKIPTLTELLKICEIEAFDFWKIVRNLMRYDRKLLFPIKLHLEKLKMKIITVHAWKVNSSVIDLIQKKFDEWDTK